MKDPIAYCGLACCVCSEREGCPGCQAGGCEQHGWCKNFNCCRERGLNGCWECPDFPCGEGMHRKPRILAFARFAHEYGPEELAGCLRRNEAEGVVYHRPGELTGEYDDCPDEAAVFALLRNGRRSVPTGGYVIEPLKPEDFRKCENIYDMDAFAYTEQFYDELVRGVRRIFVYRETEKYLAEGAIVLKNGDPEYTIPGRRAYLSHLVVRPSERGRGIGGTLLRFLIAESNRMGLRELSVGVDRDNEVALEMYRRAGFTQVLFDGEDKDGAYFKLLRVTPDAK